MTPRDNVKGQLAEYRRKRNFGVTAEPAGGAATKASPRTGKGTLRFVIQKHRASHLHFDWRLEVDGVMKSWAVPKGPSLDPGVKRLAMQVEDHPIEYNEFEGIIPAGQYGGGTVMLWDRGTYTADEAEDGDDEAEMRSGLRKGKLAFTMHGERLKGSFALVQMKGRDNDGRQWLLLKHRDGKEDPTRDIVAEVTTSVASGRTMEEIAGGRSRVWQSNRKETRGKKYLIDEEEPAPKTSKEPVKKSSTARGAKRATPRASAPKAKAKTPAKSRDDDNGRPRSQRLPALEPMLARVGETMPKGEQWTFEPKFDGIRVLAFATPSAVRLVTRNGNDKTRQFPEVADALRALAERCGRDVVLDGEVVALDAGEPARFQALQGRMHVRAEDAIAGHRKDSPTGLIAFDILVDGAEVLVHEPWKVRRKHLEKLLRAKDKVVRIAETSADGASMLGRAQSAGWEGLMAKKVDAPYEPGVRSKSWLKLKLEHRQEFVVGGWTEPRNTRAYIGSLLVGYYDRGELIYAGHVGGGFSGATLQDMARRLKPLARQTCPFTEKPKTNEPSHWVKPEVVVEVRFNEWTSDGVLRQPIFLGVRTDKDPKEIRRERESVQRKAASARASSDPHAPAVARDDRASASNAGNGDTPRAKSARNVSTVSAKAASRVTRSAKTKSGSSASANGGDVVDQLTAIEESGSNGTVRFPDGTSLEVTNLSKIYFPDTKSSKGDLMRYYAQVADQLVPATADRPFVLKRYPNGIDGKSFYQQKAPDTVPDGVRVETIRNEEGEEQRRLVGGNLATILYIVQLGAISIDPWHGRIDDLSAVDYSIVDLDPGPRATFDTVIEVAGAVREELEGLGLKSLPKTSGSRGIHIVIPLEPGTPEESGLLVAQLVATRVAERFPKIATIERSVKARPPATIYVDYLQNIRGKTVASVYSARARPGATVSAPLEWDEVDTGLDPRDFDIRTVPERIARTGDLWDRSLRSRNSLRALVKSRKSR